MTLNSSHRQRNLLIVFLVLLAVSAAFIVAANEEGRWECQDGAWVAIGDPEGDAPETGCAESDANDSINSEVPITAEYPNKVVYGITLSAQQIGAAQQDCSERAGEYRACGNACADGEEVCIDACAHICLLP